MYEDKKFGTIFQTRTGTAIGTSNERQMLDAIGGSDSFRTRLQNNQDGSVTMLRTKNGMPQFSATKPAENANLELYMESGQLGYTLPAAENTDNNKPALWRFLDIETDGKWLGRIQIPTNDYVKLGLQKLPQPTPIETGILVEGCDSLAIGYPQNLSAVIEAQTETEYSEATILKKLVARIFPPALFPGKLRLFVQAQYGAPETLANRFYVDASGAIALKYEALDERTGENQVFQFGFWPHLSQGLFTDDQFNYFLLTITLGKGSNTCIVSGRPIKLSATGKILQKYMRDDGYFQVLSKQDKQKVEAYALSDAVILANSFYIGTFDSGYIGGALCYGWKFNNNGSKAAITSVWIVGDDLARTQDCRSNTVQLSISRDAFNPDLTKGWTLEGGTTGELNWIDGWGQWSIFAPNSEIDNTLVPFSARLGFRGLNMYSFSNVPVYCFYNEDTDELVSVLVSHTVVNSATSYEQEQNGLVFRTNFMESYDPELYASTGSEYLDFGTPANAKKRSDRAAVWEKREIPPNGHTTSTVNIGDFTFYGWRKHGAATRKEWSEGKNVYQVVFNSAGSMPIQYDGAHIPMPSIAEYTAVEDYIAAAGGYWGHFDMYSYDKYHKNNAWRAEVTVTTAQSDFEYCNRWVVIIPSGDCSSAHVASQEIRTRHSVGMHTQTQYPVHHYDTTLRQVLPDNTRVEVGPSPLPYAFNALDNTVYGDSIEPNAWITDGPVAVRLWSKTLTNVPGVPSRSYGTLFNLSTEFPMYNGIMNYKESAGGRYHGTEIGGSTIQVTQNAPFVGWA